MERARRWGRAAARSSSVVGVESHWAAYVPIAPDIADVALIALTACRDRAHAAPTACCAHLLGPIPFRGRIASSPSTPRSLGCQR